MNNNQTSKAQRVITATITEKLEKVDRKYCDYLILKLDNGETVFVFPSKVKEINWLNLLLNHRYKFLVEESNNSTNILIKYE